MTMTPLDPVLAPRLTDARRQAHHAVQLATAAGISFLPHEPDDSHTNLEWLPERGALASHVIPTRNSFRVAVHVADLRLLLLDGHDAVVWELPLHGRTIAEAAEWIRARLSERGAEGRHYTLTRHYSIPVHPVANGASFDVSDRAAFAQLGAWFATAADIFAAARATAGASEVRCWPHHFDIAMLIEPAPGQSIGVGLEPGDTSYDEPYFYVNVFPAPSANALTRSLEGDGMWHTRDWIGAVLPGSRLARGDGQRRQITSFIDSAIRAARELLGSATVAGAAR
jgi:hypothetical protein